MNINVGDKVRTKTINPKGQFNNKVGTLVKIDYSTPFSHYVKFENQIVAYGVVYEGMCFRESEVQSA